MTNPKLKRAPPARLRPLRPNSTGTFILWRLVRAKPGESARWECVDGRWVALAVGTGEFLGRAIVTASDGRREMVDTYEGAFDLAKSWRD